MIDLARRPRLLLAIAAVLAYFVVFPDDLTAVMAPIVALLSPIAALLELTRAVSPWFYGVVAVAILSRAIVQARRPA